MHQLRQLQKKSLVRSVLMSSRLQWLKDQRYWSVSGKLHFLIQLQEQDGSSAYNISL